MWVCVMWVCVKLINLTWVCMTWVCVMWVCDVGVWYGCMRCGHVWCIDAIWRYNIGVWHRGVCCVIWACDVAFCEWCGCVYDLWVSWYGEVWCGCMTWCVCNMDLWYGGWCGCLCCWYVMQVCKCRHRDATALMWQLEDHFGSRFSPLTHRNRLRFLGCKASAWPLQGHLAGLNNVVHFLHPIISCLKPWDSFSALNTDWSSHQKRVLALPFVFYCCALHTWHCWKATPCSYQLCTSFSMCAGPTQVSQRWKQDLNEDVVWMPGEPCLSFGWLDFVWFC